MGSATTFSGSFCNHSGFAAGFILQPETDSWQSYPFEVGGSDAPIAFLDSSTAPSRFYRVKVRNPNPAEPEPNPQINTDL